MRSSKLFRHHRGRSIESGRDAINTIAIATAYTIKRSIIAFLPIHQPERYLCEWGKAVTGVTGMRDRADSGNGLAQLEVNAGRPVAPTTAIFNIR
jgi:hypothetical protein